MIMKVYNHLRHYLTNIVNKEKNGGKKKLKEVWRDFVRTKTL